MVIQSTEIATGLVQSDEALQAYLEQDASEHDDDKPAENDGQPQDPENDEDLFDEDDEDLENGEEEAEEARGLVKP
jgi:hypothetical protein